MENESTSLWSSPLCRSGSVKRDAPVADEGVVVVVVVLSSAGRTRLRAVADEGGQQIRSCCQRTDSSQALNERFSVLQ